MPVRSDLKENLALVNAILSGQTRERNLAEDELRKRFSYVFAAALPKTTNITGTKIGGM
jgi:hypothetical protein